MCLGLARFCFPVWPPESPSQSTREKPGRCANVGFRIIRQDGHTVMYMLLGEIEGVG
jgi:hypothetical protein